MDTQPFGLSLDAGDRLEGDAAGLLEGGVTQDNTHTHVHDLFHEDAQVR